MTPTERRALRSPAVVDAWEWLDTYCRHWAVPGRDWQTLDNLGGADRVTAEAHLATLRPRPSRHHCRTDDLNMDAYSAKLTAIIAILMILFYLINDLLLHPLPP